MSNLKHQIHIGINKAIARKSIPLSDEEIQAIVDKVLDRKDIVNPEAFAYVCAKHKCIDKTRKANSDAARRLREIEEDMALEEFLNHLKAAREEFKRVASELIIDKPRLGRYLNALDRLTFTEITPEQYATAHGVSRDCVDQWKRRGRKAIFNHGISQNLEDFLRVGEREAK